jgi:hypothetical protein
MRSICRLLVALALAGCAAQTPAGGASAMNSGTPGVTLAQAGGSIPSAEKPSIQHLITGLQAGGFQALPPTVPLPPNLQAVVIGTVQTGVGGFKVLVTANHCPNDTSDTICVIGLFVYFDDGKRLVNPEFLARANAATTFAKAIEGHKPNGDPTLVVSSWIYVKGIDYAATLPQYLPTFAADLLRIVALYNQPRPTAMN